MASGQRGKDVDEGLSTLDAVSSRYRANWGLWRACRGHTPSAVGELLCKLYDRRGYNPEKSAKRLICYAFILW